RARKQLPPSRKGPAIVVIVGPSFGGSKGIRTPDPLHAMQVRYRAAPWTRAVPCGATCIGYYRKSSALGICKEGAAERAHPPDGRPHLLQVMPCLVLLAEPAQVPCSARNADRFNRQSVLCAQHLDGTSALIWHIHGCRHHQN